MVLIRLAKTEDCKECCKLSQIKELSVADGSYVSEDYFKVMTEEDEMFFVAEEEGKIVGYVLGEPMKDSLAFLSLLTVEKALRGKDIGKRLLAKLEEQCKKKKLNPIILYAPKFNENTIVFYNKQGYMQGEDYVQFMKIL